MLFIGPGDKVPFISQVDDVKDPAWQERFCGIVCVYMVLAYWWRKRSIPHYPTLDVVSRYGLTIGGYRDGVGWIHTKLADVARHYHHETVARSWMIRDGDLDIMQNQGRAATQAEVARYREQVSYEFISTLSYALADEVPVILSVKPGFGKNSDHHLVVITGISEDASYVTVHDPQTQRSEPNQEVAIERLLEYSNYSAIFIYP